MRDLYSHGDVDTPIIASYPGSILKIYKRTFNHLPWPLWQMLVLKERRAIYNPIAKCASTSLKAMIIAMSQIPAAMKTSPLDTFSTGLQLGDFPIKEATEILNDMSYLKFALVRDPYDRLVSGYLEKFVANRMNLGNQFHTRSVISSVLGVEFPTPDDFRRSITFSQFVNYIVSTSPEQLDPHWCPQYLYLENTPHILFRLEDVDRLYDCLAIPKSLRTNIKHNATRNDNLEVDNAFTLRPDEMPHTNIAAHCFYDDDIRRKIRSYFSRDLAIVAGVAR